MEINPVIHSIIYKKPKSGWNLGKKSCQTLMQVWSWKAPPDDPLLKSPENCLAGKPSVIHSMGILDVLDDN